MRTPRVGTGTSRAWLAPRPKERRGAIKGQRGDPRNGSYEFGWDLHSVSVSGAPGGGGATPSCTIRPATSHCPQCSVLWPFSNRVMRSEEHTSELQSRLHLVCRLLLEKKKNKKKYHDLARKTKRIQVHITST